MSKTEDGLIKDRGDKAKSPVMTAKEAIDAERSIASLPPSLSLGSATVGDVTKAIHNSIVEQAFTDVQENTLKTALARSERLMNEESRKLEESKRVNASPLQPVAPAGLLVGGGILSNLQSSGVDRAALLKATLDSFESDEARARFIDTHPELFTSAPFPGQAQSPPRTQMFPQQAPQTDPTDVLQRASSLLMEQMMKGMEIQRAVSGPQQSQYQQQPVETLKIVETFKEINDKNTAAFAELIKSIQDQNRAAQEASSKMLSEQQSKIIELQMTSLEREREMEREFTKKRMEQLEAALAAPAPVTMDQFKILMEQGRANGVPVSMETPEQERIRSEINREDRKLEHSLEMEKKRLDLEMMKEGRRGAVATSVVAGLGSVFETQLLKKHPMSEAGASVAARW